MRVAIIGAGPIGLEAALYARGLGLEPVVYERGEVGESVARWGHVTLFSPWSMNVSPLGRRQLEARGWRPPPPEAFPTGRELRHHYLLPLAQALGPAVRTGTEVAAVARHGLRKAEAFGEARRAEASFRLLVRIRESGATRWEEADAVLDASGVYGQPCPGGPDGLPALGEGEAHEHVEYGLPDVLGEARGRFAGRAVLLIGSGHSAATSLLALRRLQREEPRTRIFWAYRRSGAPLEEIADDPLPGRRELASEANRLARERPAGLEVLAETQLEALHRPRGALEALLSGPGGISAVEVDRVLVQTGFRPDLSLFRELQVHLCYASEGPMKLAAALLAAGGGGGSGGDCLRTPAVGPEVHRNPEPRFFVLGQKSHGRGSAFLLRHGRAAVRDVFRLLTGRAEADLYGGEA